MIPAVQQTATARVAQILSEIDPQNTMEYQRSAEAYKKTIQAREDSLKTRLAGANVSAVKVIVAIRQADFLQWAGFTVVASFTTPQAQTPQTIRELIDKGRAEEVKLVINNLQDGQDAGKTLAQEIGAKNLNLSNFPGGFENTETWEKALDYNVDLLLKALAN
jgi:zinc transport system substrate-binding protein